MCGVRSGDRGVGPASPDRPAHTPGLVGHPKTLANPPPDMQPRPHVNCVRTRRAVHRSRDFILREAEASRSRSKSGQSGYVSGYILPDPRGRPPSGSQIGPVAVAGARIAKHIGAAIPGRRAGRRRHAPVRCGTLERECGEHGGDRRQLVVGRRPAEHLRQVGGHSGMFPCFLGGRLERLERSARSALITVVRVAAGSMTPSSSPRSAARKGLATL